MGSSGAISSGLEGLLSGCVLLGTGLGCILKALAISHHRRRNSFLASSGSRQNFPGLQAKLLSSLRGPFLNTKTEWSESGVQAEVTDHQRKASRGTRPPTTSLPCVRPCRVCASGVKTAHSSFIKLRRELVFPSLQSSGVLRSPTMRKLGSLYASSGNALRALSQMVR